MRRPTPLRAGLVLLLTLALATPATVGAAGWDRIRVRPLGTTAPAGGGGEHEGPSSDRLRLHRRGIVVFVRLDYVPVASYAGGVGGLAPTSPSVTGRPLARNAAAVGDYTRHLRGIERRAVRALHQAVPTAHVVYRYRLAYGGLAVRLPRARVDDLRSLFGVIAVQRATLEHPLTEVTPEFLGASAVWPSLGGQVAAASDVVVGVIDTGIWPEHPSFEDLGLPPVPGDRGCQFGDGSDPDLGDPFTCTDKLIGAYAFADTYLGIIGAADGEFCDNAAFECSPRDADGHGTHTASTAAGNALRPASVFGVDRGDVSGMAPGARVIAYRACLEQGCFTPDLVASVEQAIEDGVDVINYSISGGTVLEEPVEQAFLDAYAAGISVNASAGNGGPAAGSINHVSPWVVTVGAATSPRHFVTTLDLEAGNGDTLAVPGVSITDGLTASADLVRAEDVAGGDEFCSLPLPTGSATGKLVLCKRGGDIARVVKGFNVRRGGAAGMVLYNAQVQDVETDNHWLPAVHLDFPAAQQVLTFLGSHASVEGTFGSGEATAVQPDVLAAFSSRGPSLAEPGFGKPDVVGPGVQILAGKSPEPAALHAGPPGELYQAIAGTSMSSPHSAGVAALVRAAHPDWTAGQIKSALMTSAVAGVVLEDGATPAGPLDRGSGSIRADRAVDPTLTFDVTAEQYRAEAEDPARRLDMNLPGIEVPLMPGIITTTRTATNVSGQEQEFDASTTSPAGSVISVSPAHFVVPAAGTVELDIRLDGSGLAAGRHFGEILLDPADPGATEVRLPVSFDKRQGPVTLESSCQDTTLVVGQSTTCTTRVANTSAGATRFALNVGVDAPAADLTLDSVAPPGIPDGNGFRATGKLFPLTASFVRRLQPGGHPFVDLPSRGVRPTRSLDDEDVVNIGTPRFLYARQAFRAIGITSNGYIVMGGAGDEALLSTPQTFPDPAAPNAVVAPFWTDLDPSAGGRVFASRLLIRGVRWVVVQWRNVPTFRTRKLQTFEVWIRTGDVENVSFVYAKVTGHGGPRGLNIGAENAVGTSGANLGRVPEAGESFRVITAPPAGGQSRTITYRLTAHEPGTYHVTARLRSPLVRGTTVVDLPVVVAAP